MSTKKAKTGGDRVIAVNRKARHDYFIEDRFEAGLALEGWEVKSLRAGSAHLTEAYVTLKKGEAWLVGAHFSPLRTTSTHIKANPTRERKLLLHRHELDRLWMDEKGHRAPAFDELPGLPVEEDDGPDPFGSNPFGGDPFGGDAPAEDESTDDAGSDDDASQDAGEE